MERRISWLAPVGAAALMFSLGASAQSLVQAVSAADTADATDAAAAGQSAGATNPNQSTTPQLAEVVVTGTNIRGVIAPTGQQVLTTNAQALQQMASYQDTSSMLRNIPALSNFGAVDVSETGGQTQNTAPNIHQLGSSASTSTLTVMDGFRLPMGGVVHSEVDPGMIPTNAIERIDVLAGGASSIYGSDAVAGVINVVTRSDFDGLQVTSDGGFAKGQDRYAFGVLWGHNWDGGNAMLAYQNTYTGAISNASRLTNDNFTSVGGSNFDSFACSPAEIRPGGTGNYYTSASSDTTIGTAQANASCYNDAGDYFPADQRNNLMMKMTEQLTQKLTVIATAFYSINAASSTTVPTALTNVTAFGTGPQANPFYVNPPGVTATSQSIYDNLSGLLTEPYITDNGATDLYGHIESNYQISNNWVGTLDEVYGRDNSYEYTSNGFCETCAYLALNGTTNASGNPTTPDIVGTTIANTQTLTPANALDVWDPPGSTNKTSAATLAELQSGDTGTTATNTFNQLRLGFNGPAFNLPAGPVKVYGGGELYQNSLAQFVTKSNATGPSIYGSGYAIYQYARTVTAEIAEANIPAISEGMNIPFVKRLTFDLSVRHDDYSDVGPTTNPMYSGQWQITNAFTLRGDYSTSFVAPNLDSIGDPSQDYRASYGGAGADTTLTTFPTALYPGTAGVLPGCPVGAVTCTVGGDSSPGISVQRGIGATAKPAIGQTWTAGFDWLPPQVPGLVTHFTLWNTNYEGAVTAANQSVYAETGALTSNFLIFPTGISPSNPLVVSKIAPYPVLNSPLPSTIYYFANEDEQNLFNLYYTGIDYDVNYTIPTRFGRFTVGDTGTEYLKLDESFGYPNHGEVFSVLGTDGENSLFPDIRGQFRVHAGWQLSNYEADLFWNWTAGYRNWADSVAPIIHDAAGNPTGGGDWVKALSTFDFNLAYNFSAGPLKGAQVYLNGSDIFNTGPPFVNGASGYDLALASKVGRVVVMGMTLNF